MLINVVCLMFSHQLRLAASCIDTTQMESTFFKPQTQQPAEIPKKPLGRAFVFSTY